jgi:hypothetical protein
MQMPNYHFLPLYALFVDWDYFLRPGMFRTRHLRLTPFKALAGACGAAILAFEASTAFHPRSYADFDRNAYPFTAFNFYASVYPKPPYGVHQPFDYQAVKIAITCDSSTGDAAQRAADRMNAAYGPVLSGWRDHPPSDEALRSFLSRVRAGGTDGCGAKFREGSIDLVLFEVPAYPAPPEPLAIARTPFGTIDQAGVRR